MEQDKEVQSFLNTIADNAQAWLDRNEREGLVCDFCAHVLTDYVTFATDKPYVETISALNTETLGAGSIGMGYSPEWLACPSCASAVRRRDPVKLARHALDHRDVARVGPISRNRKVVEQELVSLYRRLYASGLREVKEEGGE